MLDMTAPVMKPWIVTAIKRTVPRHTPIVLGIYLGMTEREAVEAARRDRHELLVGAMLSARKLSSEEIQYIAERDYE